MPGKVIFPNTGPRAVFAGSRGARPAPPDFLFRPVRTRLLETLERDFQGGPRVLSIVAPVGYGKTVLMAGLHASLHNAGHTCFWVALDDRATSLDKVIRALHAAIFGPVEDVHPTQVLIRGGEPASGLIVETVEALSRLSRPATIFIDNLNSCRDESLGAWLDALIFRTPASIRFVWSGTESLGINLGRAKLEGLIRQIGAADLSLDAREASELLGAELEERLGRPGVEAVVRQTEGWPAAVRLAQIVLADANQPRTALEEFSGADEDVAALLNRQVLAGLGSELRDFLLRISQLRNFTADMCRHVAVGHNAERHIEVLLKRNVFIIPLDRNRRRYRFHALFREFLLNEAEQSLDVQERNEVLRRAAEWSGRNGDWHDALEYALASGALALAAEILDRTAALFVRDRGDIEQYILWAERLLGEGVQLGWEAHFWYVWALVFHRRHAHGLQQQERLAERLRRFRGKSAAPPVDLPQRIDHLRICIDFFTDRIVDAYQGAERWLEAETDRPSDPYNVGSVGGMKSLCLGSFFNLAQARQTMRVAEPILLEIGSEYTMGWISLAYATISIYEGDYRHAFDELTAGIERARSQLGEDAVLCDTLAFIASKCAVELGCDRDAEALVLQGLRTAHGHGMVDTAACGLDAAVKLWDGTADSPVAIPRLRGIASSYPPRLSLMLSCYLIQRLMHLGRTKDAVAEAEQIGLRVEDGRVHMPEWDELSIPRYRDLVAATSIDLLISNGSFRSAEVMITEEFRRAQAEGRVARLVELGLTKSAMALRAGNPRSAAKQLGIAVSRAAPRGIVRPFRDQAETVAALVNDTRLSSWAFALNEEREFFARICDGLPVANRLQRPKPLLWNRTAGADIALTKREVELLALIDAGLSNKQMIDHTEISLGTIKWHLKNVYKKLGVTNRSAALARARASGVLPK